MPFNVRASLESRLSFSPILRAWAVKLYDSRIAHFFLVGASAAGLHILCAWLLTEFAFGLSRYYIGYFIGMGVSWTFNFLMHMFFTFGVSDKYATRLTWFIVHSVITNLLQAWAVTSLTTIVGQKYYLIVIFSVILAISLATFAVYKFWLFAAAKKTSD